MPLLKVTGLTKFFGGLRAVHDLSFDVQPGEILGLIGPNGAGKTTAFNLIAGFIRPTRGQVLLEGENIVGMKPYAVTRKGIARTFQIVKPFRKLSVLENVTLAAFLRFPSRREAESQAPAEREPGMCSVRAWQPRSASQRRQSAPRPDWPHRASQP